MPDNKIRMPRSTIEARTSPCTIQALMMSLAEQLEKPEWHRQFYPWADRFVMGLPLPHWQRPLVWSDEQKIAFIESIWNEVDAGSYLVNKYEDGIITTANNEVSTLPFTDCVLDGQQRLSAIEDYVLDKIAVPDADGIGRLYSELPTSEQRRFKNSTFSKSTISSNDEQILRKVYNLRAFGGVAHNEDQRAIEAQPTVWPARQRIGQR